MSDDEAQKEQYALALLDQPDRDPYKAALIVFPGDIAKALIVSREWVQDPDVQAHINGMTPAERDAKGTMSRNEIARRFICVADDANDPEIKIKALIQVRETLYPKENGTTVNNNNTLVDNRRVMVVTDHGTDAEWEAKLLAQQEKLIADAAEPITVN